ncbi:hypothetical protein [Streptomyces anandii]|uniref:hypothetical protein n=1 Tax=Streptomyces anandii TaxID=285454 RepID=UPI00167AF41C|nr:hypothetical protein [Streptomyces anandii]GGY10160.1 hypothetical protein GCM10010510_65230 [Streptomyces anandii JCM 4720]
MNAEFVLRALCTGAGLGFLLPALGTSSAAARLWLHGLRVTGVVAARAADDPRRGAVVVFRDHLGRDRVLDPGRYGPLCGLPQVGGQVTVVFARARPAAARLWTPRHLLAPPFGWFLCSALAFGTGVMATA